MKATAKILYLIGLILSGLFFIYVFVALILVKAIPDTLISDGAADNVEQLNSVFWIFLGMTLLLALEIVLLVFSIRNKEEAPSFLLSIPLTLISLLCLNLPSLIGGVIDIFSQARIQKSKQTKTR